MDADKYICHFYGGPLDGERIIIPAGTYRYFKPIPMIPSGIAQEDPIPYDIGILCYAYERRGDAMYYVGERQR